MEKIGGESVPARCAGIHADRDKMPGSGPEVPRLRGRVPAPRGFFMARRAQLQGRDESLPRRGETSAESQERKIEPGKSSKERGNNAKALGEPKMPPPEAWKAFGYFGVLQRENAIEQLRICVGDLGQ